jgi:hypothetical protein
MVTGICEAQKNRSNLVLKALFTLGVKANVQPKSRIPIGAKLERSAPRASH